jgi:hypothetical protein
MKNVLFISWEKHQRTNSLCKTMGIPLFEIVSPKHGISRYIHSLAQTFKIIKRERPVSMLVQNPSIVLTLFCLLLRPFFSYRLIVDAHNEAITPFIHNLPAVVWISRILIKYSDHTIVTNEELATKVRTYGGRPLVLPDLLPKVDPTPFLAAPNDDQKWRVTLISTYAEDEPYEEVFKAISRLGDKFILSVTGKIPKQISQLSVPGNVALLGYLSHQQYWELLLDSHILIDLTTMDNCLVCGAYEGLAINKPLLLSNNQASVSLFGNYATHVSNNANTIAEGILDITTQYNALPKKIKRAKEEFLEKEKLSIMHLIGLLEIAA